MANPDVAERLAPLIEGGVVATTPALHADALYSARGADEYEVPMSTRSCGATGAWPTNTFRPTIDHWQAALNAQRELGRAGRHRLVGVHDLLTAVLAGAHNMTVVHYNSDFEIAATVLAFEHRWVLPHSTL